jgi:DNA-binding winged helix-turn-helix (wHTH) protein
VTTRTTIDLRLERLIQTTAAERPRVLVLAAPAGYAKATFLRAYAGSEHSLVRCELVAEGEATNSVLDALVSSDPKRAARSAADRLAYRRESSAASSRAALRREWIVPRDPDVFVIHDATDALTTPAGADLWDELVRTCPPSRTLALSVRSPLPPALAQRVGSKRTVTLGPSDLALSADDVRALAHAAGIRPEIAEAVYHSSQGWPLPVLLIMQLLLREPVERLLEAIDAISLASLLPFTIHRTIAAADDDLRKAVAVAALLPDASHRRLTRILGESCDDAVFARLNALPFVEQRGGRALVHPAVMEVLRERFEALVGGLYERTLRVLAGDGAYVEAARVALDAGDPPRAAAIIDAAPPYTAAPVPLDEYARIIDRIDRIDRNLITRFPNVWIATIPYRSFSVNPATYVREAETIYYCLPTSAAADQRAAVLMLLVSAYVNLGRGPDAYELLDEALAGFARAQSPARASILNLAAALRGIEGRFALAREFAFEASAITRDAFGESLTLLYLDSHEAAYRGKQDRLTVIMDEVLRRRRREGLPLYVAYAAASGAIFSWVNGDDAGFERYITIMEDAITPGLEAGLLPIVDAARGRPVRAGHESPWPALAAMSQIYQIGSASTDEKALATAREAARNADVRGDPWMQLLAHLAIYLIDAESRGVEAEILRRVVADIESPELREAIDGVTSGAGAGVLEPYVTRRIRREPSRSRPTIAIDLLAGRVRRGDAAVRLTEKEFELLALLASTHGPMSRIRIGEALWDHLDPEEWRTNLKVTLHRLRTKLGERDVVLLNEGYYRVGPLVEVDLRRADALIRERATEPLDDATRSFQRGRLRDHGSHAAGRW